MQEKDKEENEINEPLPLTVHTMSVCLVPPDSAADIWNIIQQTRTLLKDPGLYRWPPHINLLYPFHNITFKQDDKEEDPLLIKVIEKLHLATKCVEPFEVHLTDFGTFGGKYRACLWMNPKSFEIHRTNEVFDGDLHLINNTHLEPLLLLQAELEKQFPSCNDVKKASGSFVPHLTVAQLPCLDDALVAKDLILDTWGEKHMEYWDKLRFTVEEIYLLKRIGDNGQFSKLATIKLGRSSLESAIEFYDPIRSFKSMPLHEEDWIRKERMDLKDRRNKNGRKRRT